MKAFAFVAALGLLAGCTAPVGEIVAETSEPIGSPESQTVQRCAQNATPEEVFEVTVVTNSGPHAAPYIMWAEKMGCFEENGLSVTLVQAGAPSDRLAALVSGAADVAWLPNDPLVAAVVNGGIDLVVVSPHDGFTKERLAEAKAARTFEGSLIIEGVALAAPGSSITSFAELEGTKIGRQSAISNIGVGQALEEAGVNLDSIQWVDIEQSERLVGLLRGDLDVAVLAGVNALKAMRAGAEFLFYYQAWDRAPGVDSYWVASPESVQQNYEGVVRYRQAMWDLYELLGDTEQELEFFTFVIELLEGEPGDINALRLPDFFPRAPIPEDIENHMTMMFERGDIDELVNLRETSLFILTDG